MWTWMIAAALAAPPTTSVVDGVIVSRMSLAAPVAAVRAKVADPLWVNRTEGGTTAVTVVGREGDCLLVEAVSSSVFIEARYATRQCPTADGFVSTLRSSNTFSSYRASWRVVPDGAGSAVEYRLEMVTKIAIPHSWVEGTARKRVHGMMEKVGAALGG